MILPRNQKVKQDYSKVFWVAGHKYVTAATGSAIKEMISRINKLDIESSELPSLGPSGDMMMNPPDLSRLELIQSPKPMLKFNAGDWSFVVDLSGEAKISTYYLGKLHDFHENLPAVVSWKNRSTNPDLSFESKYTHYKEGREHVGAPHLPSHRQQNEAGVIVYERRKKNGKFFFAEGAPCEERFSAKGWPIVSRSWFTLDGIKIEKASPSTYLIPNKPDSIIKKSDGSTVILSDDSPRAFRETYYPGGRIKSIESGFYAARRFIIDRPVALGPAKKVYSKNGFLLEESYWENGVEKNGPGSSPHSTLHKNDGGEKLFWKYTRKELEENIDLLSEEHRCRRGEIYFQSRFPDSHLPKDGEWFQRGYFNKYAPGRLHTKIVSKGVIRITKGNHGYRTERERLIKNSLYKHPPSLLPPSQMKWKKGDTAPLGIKPSRDELHTLLWSMPTVDVAKIFRVSGKAIEKWAAKFNVEKPARGYWQKQLPKSPPLTLALSPLARVSAK